MLSDLIVGWVIGMLIKYSDSSPGLACSFAISMHYKIQWKMQQIEHKVTFLTLYRYLRALVRVCPCL